jgi:hypothetical protein
MRRMICTLTLVLAVFSAPLAARADSSPAPIQQTGGDLSKTNVVSQTGGDLSKPNAVAVIVYVLAGVLHP